MDKKDSKFSEELLSAYLDDELSVAERELVEEAIVSSQTLKKTLEDLERLKKKLSDLPRFELGRPFRDQVCAKVPRANQRVDRMASWASINSRIGLWSLAITAAAALILLVRLPFRESSIVDRDEAEQLAAETLEEEGVDQQKFIPPTQSDIAIKNGKQEFGEQISSVQPAETNHIAAHDRFAKGEYLADLAANLQSDSYRFVAIVNADQSIDIEGAISNFFDGSERLSRIRSDVGKPGFRYLGVETTVAELEEFNKKWQSKLRLSVAEASEVLQTTSQPNVRYHFWKRNLVDNTARSESEPSANDLYVDLENTDGKSELEKEAQFPNYSDIENRLRVTKLSQLDVNDAEERFQVLFSIAPKIAP